MIVESELWPYSGARPQLTFDDHQWVMARGATTEGFDVGEADLGPDGGRRSWRVLGLSEGELRILVAAAGEQDVGDQRGVVVHRDVATAG